jgi:hypothetical protein
MEVLAHEHQPAGWIMLPSTALLIEFPNGQALERGAVTQERRVSEGPAVQPVGVWD